MREKHKGGVMGYIAAFIIALMLAAAEDSRLAKEKACQETNSSVVENKDG